MEAQWILEAPTEEYSVQHEGFNLLGSAESRVKCCGWRLGSLDKLNAQREHEGAIVPKVWELCESRLNSTVE